ncbi:hypothetical protein [Streptomyces sp. NPDC058011]|uniref:hypothetical protein n=1 Tax=Streptomyces sp. NPDC058011 TaxID=3346305 RepID=UPI0036E3AB42
MAGRLATVSGGAVRRGRTAAGRARSTAEVEVEAGAGAGAAAAWVAGAGEVGAAPAFAARCTVGMAAEPEPEPGREPASGPTTGPTAAPAPGPGPGVTDPASTSRTGFRVVRPDRRTDALRAGVPPPARAATAAVPASASASASAPSGRAARSSSGPPGEAERAEPGRVTPWMRPTGADGRTAWPSSPPSVGFCQEASCDRNRSPSLTPIEARATVTAGGAT